jgi:beta-lactamase class A
VQDFAHFPFPEKTPFYKKIPSVLLFTSFLFLIIVVIMYIILLRDDQKNQTAIISPLARSPEDAYTAVKGEFISPELSAFVQSAYKKQPDGRYAVVIKNMKTGETFAYHEHDIFTSASLYKLWLAATAYKQLSEGTIKGTTFLQNDVQSLNTMFHIASDSAERTEGTVAMTVNEAINRAITISDNYAALILSSKVRVSNMALFLSSENFTESKVGNTPQTSAADIASFFEKLYYKQLINPQSSETLLSILKKQQINDRIPKYLPPFIETAHKTGELDGNKHDAGIVFAPTGDYIFIALTETDRPTVAAEETANLSKEVYDYFQQKAK